MNGVVGFEYNNVKYYYLKNVQGDITAIYDEAGNLKAEYEYDAWGNHVITLDVGGIGTLNPFRYRCYYFDEETGLYYLQSRYYDPEVGRWISPEPNVCMGGFDKGAGVVRYNVYVYCSNNPIVFKDETGESITATCVVVGALIGLAVGAVGGSHWAEYKHNLTIDDGWEYLKYVVGFGIGGAAAGALIGWSVGAAATAIGASLPAGSTGTIGLEIYSSWQQAEQVIRDSYNAVKHTFNIPGMSNRIVDGFNKSKGVIYEVKYGYASLSQFIQTEISRDIWLRANDPLVKEIEWHFFKSQVTGLGGPSEPLLKALADARIKVVFH